MRYEAHQILGGTDEILSIRVLTHLPVDLGSDGQAVYVKTRRDARPKRAESIKSFGPGPLTVFGLKVPGRNVVDAGHTKEVVCHLLWRHCVHGTPYDDRHLPFVVHPTHPFWEMDGLSRTYNCRGGFQADERLLGCLPSELLYVSPVHQAHNNNLRRFGGRQQRYLFEGQCPAGLGIMPKVGAVNLGNDSIAQDSHPLVSAAAIPDEQHQFLQSYGSLCNENHNERYRKARTTC